MSPLDCLRGIAAAYVSPVTLLACIILVPAAVAFAVVSYVLRKDWQYQEEEEDIANGGGETDLRAPWRRNTRSQYYNTVENSAPACPLEEELVQMIPVVKYTSTSSSNSCLPSDSSSAIVGGDHCESCVVCLAQFEEEEVVKVLPPCQHSFHAPCIDRWFQTHSTCPLCRRKVLTIDIEAPAPDHHHYHDQQQGMDHHHTLLPPPLQSNAPASAEYPSSSSSARCIVIVIV